MKDYHINIFFSEEDGGYIADIPDLPHCSAFGETKEQALSEVLKAKTAWSDDDLTDLIALSRSFFEEYSAHGKFFMIDVLRDEDMTPFTKGDLDLLQLFANQAALALENARLIEGAQRRVEQLGLLHEMTLSAVGAGDRAAFLDVLAQRMPRLLDADCCMITRWDEPQGTEGGEGASGALLEASPRLQAHPGEATLTEAALRAGRVLAIESVAESDLLAARLASAFPTRSALVVPLIAAERGYGAVILGFEQRRTFRPEEIALAEQAGALVALAMAKLQAIDAEQGRTATLAALRQASLVVTSRLDLDAVLQSVLEDALKLYRGDDGHIFLFDGERLTFGADPVGSGPPCPLPIQGQLCWLLWVSLCSSLSYSVSFLTECLPFAGPRNYAIPGFWVKETRESQRKNFTSAHAPRQSKGRKWQILQSSEMAPAVTLTLGCMQEVGLLKKGL